MTLLDGVCNGLVTSSFCSLLCTQTTSAPTTQAHGVSHRPESNKGIKGQTTDLSKAPDTPKDEDNQQADDSPLPYRGNPGIIGDLKNEDGGVELDYPDGNEQDENEEGDGDEGLNADKKPDDDLMEKVFHDEQQRRLNLLGNSDHSEIKSQMCVSDNSRIQLDAQVCFTQSEFVTLFCSITRVRAGLLT